ncbi:uncharacterized protein LOC111077057 [Drosophila obscura]|uniref:uncharacterized protein LOC111077057 n=1 Tax=Drosophila obscura TaxID=7282 RepID=UPI001BB22DE4|nr:uncharacterized protein LOC111077057 [Drosophila obscura]
MHCQCRCQCQRLMVMVFVLTLLVASSSGANIALSTTVETVSGAPAHICLLPPVCEPDSPRVCGRFPDGKCQRFNNICHLLEAHHNGKPAYVRHVPVRECRFVAAVGHHYRRPCNGGCTARRVPCKRTPHSAEICVRSSSRKECQLLANSCQLRQQNCHATPRHSE